MPNWTKVDTMSFIETAIMISPDLLFKFLIVFFNYCL